MPYMKVSVCLACVARIEESLEPRDARSREPLLEEPFDRVEEVVAPAFLLRYMPILLPTGSSTCMDGAAAAGHSTAPPGFIMSRQIRLDFALTVTGRRSTAPLAVAEWSTFRFIRCSSDLEQQTCPFPMVFPLALSCMAVLNDYDCPPDS